MAALQAALEGTIDPDGEVWLSYAGHAHVYRGPEGRARPLELVREGGRVLLGTAHGVILTDPGRSRHVWIYVSAGGDKLRYSSIVRARLQGDTAIITLQTSRLDPDSPPGGREVRVNLKTGAVSR